MPPDGVGGAEHRACQRLRSLGRSPAGSALYAIRTVDRTLSASGTAGQRPERRFGAADAAGTSPNFAILA